MTACLGLVPLHNKGDAVAIFYMIAQTPDNLHQCSGLRKASSISPSISGQGSKKAQIRLKAREETIKWVIKQQFPALPIAPKQDPHKYPLLNNGKIVYESDRATPKPRFTGKNPSYLDCEGKPHLINHSQYQNQLPTKEESERWFANPENGIGTLGGLNNTIWIDLDLKKFATESDCDSAAMSIYDRIHKQTGVDSILERTHSGGWRMGVRVEEKPTFTNFAITPGGTHVGEALGKGRFTVLAPTIGPSGKEYLSYERADELPKVKSLESIGIYPVKVKPQSSGGKTDPQLIVNGNTDDIPGTIPLEQLGSKLSTAVLNGNNTHDDNSHSLTAAIKEWYGWENWCQKNGVTYSGTTHELAHDAGGQLGIDDTRIDRIIKGIDQNECHPAAEYTGDEESCWKKIRQVERATFEAKCPLVIKEKIKQDLRQRNRGKRPNNTSGGKEEPTSTNEWNAPVSWNGEIGWLLPVKIVKTEIDPETGEQKPILDKKGKPIKETQMKFFPKCNFDFQIEMELASVDGINGGGIVIQVKRSIDNDQKQVIISSLDYGSTKDFEASLKKALGQGIVCNLKNEALKALIHVRLRDYRERGGLIYKLQDRAGQQIDGHWVFKNCQISKDGKYSTVPNSDWIFNPNLGAEDKMPNPQIAAPDPNALKRLVAAMKRFHGAEGIFPGMIALGFVGAGVHYQEIMSREKRFPQLNLFGDPGSNKSVCAANALSLVGWLNGDGMLSGVSESGLYETLKNSGSLPLCWDDPKRDRQIDDQLKRLYNGIARKFRGNYQEPHSPLMVTSNHVIGEDLLATLTRMLQIPVFRQSDGDPNAWDEMQEAQRQASGALPDLIKLGYSADEIRQLEKDLRGYLPKSHPRIAASMALVLWYSMAIGNMADFDANSIKDYAIKSLCPIANAADSNTDSITDFIDKLTALQSEALVGEWNCRFVENTSIGEAIAIHMSAVWPLIDKRFNPPYSRKVLEALISRTGGKVQDTQRFHKNKDESLAYYRAIINSREDSEEDLVLPKEPTFITKRCLLIPASLVQEFLSSWQHSTTTP